MKKYIKFPNKVIEIVYNSKTRLITHKAYLREHPYIVFIRKGFAEKPLDMFFQSDKDLLNDVDFYTSNSRVEKIRIYHTKFFGGNRENLKLYYEI